MVSQRRSAAAEQPAAESITDVLKLFLEIRTVEAVAAVARDGFVIEYSGLMPHDMDALGASVCEMLVGVDRMGSELDLALLNRLVLEFERNLVVCEPVGDDVVLSVICSDSNALGVVRFYMKKLTPLLLPFF